MQEEYDRYLGLRRPYTGPDTRLQLPENILISITAGEKEFDVVSDAMEKLSRDNIGRKREFVGAINGCVTRVVDARISKNLEYMQSVLVSHGEWEPNGGYTMLASNEETRGIGIYFRAGKMGYIMPVCGEQSCVVLRSDDLEGFVAEGLKQFEMKLIGGIW
jgi:hypothetical protein